MTDQGRSSLYYRRRLDGRIAITIDSNAWNFLLDEGIDLASEFPLDRFALFISREIEIENLAIPDVESKQRLKAFIERSIEACHIETSGNFGFFVSEHGDKQRYRGFGGGTFRSETEREFYALIQEQYLIGKSERGSGLTHNEGDAAVGAASFFSVVLTNERPDKSGPLRIAFEKGGKILYLRRLKDSGQALRELVLSFECV